MSPSDPEGEDYVDLAFFGPAHKLVEGREREPSPGDSDSPPFPGDCDEESDH